MVYPAEKLELEPGFTFNISRDKARCVSLNLYIAVLVAWFTYLFQGRLVILAHS